MTKILETEVKHRKFDDVWMLYGKILDHDNTYRYRNEEGRMVSYVPEMWIILDVKSDKNKLRKKGKRSNDGISS